MKKRRTNGRGKGKKKFRGRVLALDGGGRLKMITDITQKWEYKVSIKTKTYQVLQISGHRRPQKWSEVLPIFVEPFLLQVTSPKSLGHTVCLISRDKRPRFNEDITFF